MSRAPNFKEFLVENFHTEFAGILTLDLRKDAHVKRDELYELFHGSHSNFHIEKLVNLDTVWYIKCFDFSSKKLANEFVLEFLKQCVEQLKISRISISFNLSLTYLHSKPPYKNMTDILIDYSLFDDGYCKLQNYIEPSYPLAADWSLIDKDWFIRGDF